VTVIQGVIFVVCVLLFRRGVVGEISYRLTRWRGNPRLAKAAGDD
jgi:branched-chain amino acid transport system permease protein